MSHEKFREFSPEEWEAAGKIRNAEKKFYNAVYEADFHRGDDPEVSHAQVSAEVWVDGVIASVERKKMLDIAAEFTFAIGQDNYEMVTGQETLFDQTRMIYEFYDTFGSLQEGEEVVILSSEIAKKTQHGLEIILPASCIRLEEDYMVGDSSLIDQTPRLLRRTQSLHKSNVRG